MKGEELRSTRQHKPAQAITNKRQWGEII